METLIALTYLLVILLFIFVRRGHLSVSEEAGWAARRRPICRSTPSHAGSTALAASTARLRPSSPAITAAAAGTHLPSVIVVPTIISIIVIHIVDDDARRRTVVRRDAVRVGCQPSSLDRSVQTSTQGRI